MNIQDFQTSLSNASPPSGLSLALKALWFDAQGDWEKAHACAQEEEGQDGSWVHAYLHRKEGDTANAQYWYSRAGCSFSHGPLDSEWTEITVSLLEQLP